MVFDVFMKVDFVSVHNNEKQNKTKKCPTSVHLGPTLNHLYAYVNYATSNCHVLFLQIFSESSFTFTLVSLANINMQFQDKQPH